MLDLILPLECGGCGAPSTRWCAACASELTVADDEPHLFTPRTDPGVPVFALGRHAGARRRAIVAAKEHGRTDLIEPLAGALHSALQRLLTWGIVGGNVGAPLTLVPAPTRRTAARRRGGDPVSRITVAAAVGLPGVRSAPVLRLRPWVRDSVGLSGTARQRNIAGRVRLVTPIAGEVVLVDDIVTTGATAAESVRMLVAAGAQVSAVLAIAHA
ncbi:putative amidophosphoribosyltransferase [Mycobacterium frederiksbergense]|jgi:predicted amidophosphoribosyltransferase|uniref:Amidophosphoribosyltransferase n=1 Tax=Mycolicibacterium frederiksbergense TaxID=117567 RepID=A0ABT6L1C6_9MYCO|nr:ComF family protein [Mycolicibacterium frederiksbergense]MDH6196752.1 putative amidophosphoribosyltransferase [Mycolicibacterium frederiksbergense]